MIRVRGSGGSGTDATKISQLEDDVGMVTASELNEQPAIKLAMTALQPEQLDAAMNQKITTLPAVVKTGVYSDLSGKPALFSGVYADLTGKPSIPAAQVQSDWSATSGLGVALNKPVLFSGVYADLTNKPTIPAAQVQSDWSATAGLGVILNKPTIPALPARYAKRLTTAADGTLTLTWPAGRFIGVPVATAVAIINASDYVYRAQILTCDTTGMTLRVTRSAVANQAIIVGGLVKLNETLTAAVDVMVTAQATTD